MCVVWWCVINIVNVGVWVWKNRQKMKGHKLNRLFRLRVSCPSVLRQPGLQPPVLTDHGGSEGALWLTDYGGGGKGRADRTPHGDEGEVGSGLLLPPQPQ